MSMQKLVGNACDKQVKETFQMHNLRIRKQMDEVRLEFAPFIYR